MANAHANHQADLDRMRVQLQHLCKENERLLSCEQQWSNERQMLHNEQKQLQTVCQALAKQLEEVKPDAAAGAANDSNSMASLSEEMAHLKLKAADQEALQKRLQEYEVENQTLRRACAQQRATIAQRNLAGDNDKASAQVQEILSQAQAQMSAERQNYERALEDMNRQIQKKDEEIATYQAQLKLFNDDFHAEHREREKANSDVKQLREELNVTKELLAQYTSEQMNNAHHRRAEAMKRIHEQHYKSHNGPLHANYASSQPYFRQRGAGIVVCDGEDERPLDPDEDIIDSLVEPDNQNNASSSHDSDAQLQCPNCNQGFPIEQHSQFLDHIDECTR